MSNIINSNPFFVVGAQRSGTTMLRLMLNEHPQLCVPFETDFLHFHKRLASYGDLSLADNVSSLLDDMASYSFIRKAELIEDKAAILARPAASFADVVDNIFSLYAERRGKVVWGDKTPSFVTEIDTLRELFPSCRVIHIVRDGRDVALSLAGIDWGSSHIPRVAEDWRWKTLIGHKVGRMLGSNYLEIRYEDLVLRPESILERICAFLGLKYDSAMLNYHKNAAAKMPSDSLKWHASSVAAPDQTKVFQWKKKMRQSDRILFDQIAGDALDLFGYERFRGRPSLSSKLRGLYYTLIKRW